MAESEQALPGFPGPQIQICGVNEIAFHADQSIDYLISLNDPESPTPTPPWIRPTRHISIDFYDVEEDVPGYACPEMDDVEALLRWFVALAAKDPRARILIQCRQGRSRSTAVALAFLALLHPQSAPESLLGQLLVLRPSAFPNQRIVDFADELMKRGGALSRCVREFKARRTQEILAIQREKPAA